MWTAVGSHVCNAKIFLPAVFADIVSLFARLIEFVMVLRSIRMADTTIRLQHGKAGETLSTVLAVVIGHDKFLLGLDGMTGDHLKFNKGTCGLAPKDLESSPFAVS